MSPVQPGQTWNGYAVEAVLASGATAEVLRVRHLATGQRYALKVLSSAHATSGRRLAREAGALALLRHANIVRTHGFLDVGTRLGLLLELVEGGTLDGPPRPPAEALALFRGVLAGVAHAHEQGFVHRDLKPANVLLTKSGVPKVADFGLVRAITQDAFAAHLTDTGTAMGTLGFCAPEQLVDAKRASHVADVYSLGCLLYAMITGHPPFRARVLVDVYDDAMRGRWSREHDLPGPIVAAIGAALAPEPSARPATCGHLAALLYPPAVAERIDGRPPAADPAGATLDPDEF